MKPYKKYRRWANKRSFEMGLQIVPVNYDQWLQIEIMLMKEYLKMKDIIFINNKFRKHQKVFDYLKEKIENG